MKAPYDTNCTSDWSITGYNIEPEVKYSLAVSSIDVLKAKCKIMWCLYLFLFQSCQRYCLQKDIYETCNCFHPNLVVAKLNPFTSKKPCLITPDPMSIVFPNSPSNSLQFKNNDLFLLLR